MLKETDLVLRIPSNRSTLLLQISFLFLCSYVIFYVLAQEVKNLNVYKQICL